METKIKHTRERKQLTQLEVSNKVNISVRQYRRIELGEQMPNVSVAILIAQILETTVEELFK